MLRQVIGFFLASVCAASVAGPCGDQTSPPKSLKELIVLVAECVTTRALDPRDGKVWKSALGARSLEIIPQEEADSVYPRFRLSGFDFEANARYKTTVLTRAFLDRARGTERRTGIEVIAWWHQETGPAATELQDWLKTSVQHQGMWQNGLARWNQGGPYGLHLDLSADGRTVYALRLENPFKPLLPLMR